MLALLSLILGPVLSSVTSIFTKVEDTQLGKFKVSGGTDAAVIQGNVSIIQAQAAVQMASKGDQYLRYGFGYPLAIWWTAIMFDSVFHKLGYWDWRVEALPPQVTPYVPWIIGYLFLHSVVTDFGRKT